MFGFLRRAQHKKIVDDALANLKQRKSKEALAILDRAKTKIDLMEPELQSAAIWTRAQCETLEGRYEVAHSLYERAAQIAHKARLPMHARYTSEHSILMNALEFCQRNPMRGDDHKEISNLEEIVRRTCDRVPNVWNDDGGAPVRQAVISVLDEIRKSAEHQFGTNRSRSIEQLNSVLRWCLLIQELTCQPHLVRELRERTSELLEAREAEPKP